MPTPSTTPCSWDIRAGRVYQQFISELACERETDTATDVYHFTQVSIENVGVCEWDGVQIGLRWSRSGGRGTGTVQVTHCTFLPDTGAPSYLSIVQVADEAFRVVTWLLHKSWCSICSTLDIDFYEHDIRNNLYSFTPIKIQDFESCWWIKQTICCKFKKFQSECRWPSFVFWEITKEWCKIYGCRGGESSLGWNLINDACTIPTSRCHKVAGSLTCAAKFRLFFACSVSRTFCCSSGLTMKTSALISMEVFVPNDTIQLMRTCY